MDIPLDIAIHVVVQWDKSKGGKIMEFVKPIRGIDEIEAIKNELTAQGKERERVLFVLGINTGLRISDILNLKWEDIETAAVKIRERKTKKIKRFILNDAAREALNSLEKGSPSAFVFESHSNRNGGEKKPWTEQYVWTVLSKAGKACGLESIGTHSLRKTFAFHVYQKTNDLPLVQKLLNHSSAAVTLRYIGIEQADMDACYAGLNL